MELTVVGRGKQTGPLEKRLARPSEVVRAQEHFPDLMDYSLPTLGASSECNTLYNSLHNRKLYPINKKRLDIVVEQASQRGPHARLPPWVNPNVSFKDLVEAIVSVAATLNEVAGPGYPFCLLAPTKSEVLERFGDFVYRCVIEKFFLLGFFDFTQIIDPVLIYQLGLFGLLKVLCKNEAHKNKKLLYPGCRAIVNPPIDDELLSKLINCYMKEEVMKSWGLNQSSCLGMGRTPEDNEKMCNIVYFAQAQGLELASSDISGFEHSIQKEFNDAETELTIKRYGCENNEFACNLIRNTRHLERIAAYILSDGKVIAKSRNHGTASGGDMTSLGNTNKRELLAGYIVGPDCWSRENGDDNIEEYTENAVEKYASIGITVKDYVKLQKDGPFEFCSAFYHKGRIKPINITKSFFHLLRSPRNELELGLFMKDYSQHEKYEECKRALYAIGWIANL